MPNLFDLDNVVFRYDSGPPALDGLAAHFTKGCRIALLGANGSGKSTLLRMLDALCFPDSGSIAFEGELLSEKLLRDQRFQLSFRRRVSLIFQNPDVQLFNPTVFDEVAFGPLQLRWEKEEIRERVTEALEKMEIAHLRDRTPHRLSGGEKKRVALASVLVLDPEVLLLDEPTSGLDPRTQSHLIDLISEMKGPRTVITATHDLSIVDDIADLCFVLDSGKIVASGTPGEILSDLELLQRTNLVHAHRHSHGNLVHSHPHRHGEHHHE